MTYCIDLLLVWHKKLTGIAMMLGIKVSRTLHTLVSYGILVDAAHT